jgi:hypothetical protein
MSTLGYAALTTRRDQATPGTSTTTQSPGLRTWVDSMASLVPAEVLALHGAIMALATKTETTDKSNVTTIPSGNIPTLIWVFFALMATSVLLYVGARIMAKAWDNLDFVRMLIPPLAFVAWTMLQKATAFDAVCTILPPGANPSAVGRDAIALIGAALLGLLAALLGYKADQKPTT